METETATDTTLATRPTSTTETAAAVRFPDLKNPFLAGLLAWLVPGLGHFYQGRMAKALLYFVCIYSLFFFGYHQGAYQNVYVNFNSQLPYSEWRWSYLAQFGVGPVVLPALIKHPPLRASLPESWRQFQLEPLNNEIDQLYLKYGKLINVALVFTILAGLLNYLAILDALAGPAWWEEERKFRLAQLHAPLPTAPTANPTQATEQGQNQTLAPPGSNTTV